MIDLKNWHNVFQNFIGSSLQFVEKLCSKFFAEMINLKKWHNVFQNFISNSLQFVEKLSSKFFRKVFIFIWIFPSSFAKILSESLQIKYKF